MPTTTQSMREIVAWKLALVSILSVASSKMSTSSDDFKEEMLKNADSFIDGLRNSGYEIVPIASATA